MKNKNKDGFSLMEILLTMAVIGLILAMVIPNLNQGTKAASEQSVQLNIKHIDALLQIASANGIDLGNDPQKIIESLNRGIRTDSGTWIQLSVSIAPEDVANLVQFMVVEDGRVIYYPEGVPKTKYPPK